MATRFGRQGTLFAAQNDLFDGADAPLAEEDAPPEMIAALRAELNATLAKVRAAERLPFRDFTQAALAEMRFHSISQSWLPMDEGAALREAFDREMDRIYAAEAAAAPE